MMTNKTSETIQQPVAGDQPATVAVRFEFKSATAKSVCVAGTFNEWNPTTLEMRSDGEGRWGQELILPPGTYEYLFVVDGEWTEDPQAAESALNPFGGRNSVLTVPAADSDR